MCKLLPEKIKVKTTFCGNLIMGGIADMKLLTILEVKGYSGYVESLRMLKYFGVKHQEV